MSAASDNFENKLIDWLLRGQAIGLAGASAGAGTGPCARNAMRPAMAPSGVSGSSVG